jgi:FHS family L-fucose permease-like MFS transporter
MLFALGSFLFIPAAEVREYWFFLVALFIAACGATFLETIANPYATVLGDPSTAEQRLNFAQSFNGVGAFLAPLIGSKFIFSGVEHTKEELQSMSPQQLTTYLSSEASTIKMPYLVIGCVIVFVIILFALTKLPEIKEDDSVAHGTKFSLNVFKFRHVKWAMLSEFCYVGAQVGVGSFFIRFSKELMNLDEKNSWLLVGFHCYGRVYGWAFYGNFFYALYKACKITKPVCHYQYFIACICFNKPQPVFCLCSNGGSVFHVNYVPHHFCAWYKRAWRRNKNRFFISCNVYHRWWHFCTDYGFYF